METPTTIHHLCTDIWQEIFQYFNALEVLYSFTHLTNAADALLFNEHHRLYLRGLVVDRCTRRLPENKCLSRIISLELHENKYVEDIRPYSEVRSLKLIGDAQWIINVLIKASNTVSKLERLVLIIPGVGLLYDLLASTSTLLSLRRLAIHAEDVEERVKTATSLLLRETEIEQFTLHSCSSITWYDLAHMSHYFHNVRFLDITLFDVNRNPFMSYDLPKLRSISLTLVEVPFDSIIQFVATTPVLVKIRLNGLANDQGYVVNNKWRSLFQFCPSLIKVTVNLSLEQDTNSFYNDIIQAALQEFNLELKCLDDDNEYYCGGTCQRRWWNLSGIIIKNDKYIEGKNSIL
ncbi:unnamed protein product [Adineta ricciae]|uniref:Uncharacterized protein n=1 Tax=Adineta ricciae TaxID=249248 RepID=A0A815CIP3_ADIRI|nr:unnamed protein product [Adineta ricciae]CAF1446004.1 unnamed protein product [Adineta ricciae]